MAEAPLVRDGKVVNVTSSIVATPLIKSGPCSDMRDSSVRLVFVKRTLGARSSCTESVKVEIIALWVCSVLDAVLRRFRVPGSTSKTVLLELFMGAVVSGGLESGFDGTISLYKVSRTCSNAWPSRLEPRQVSGEEAR